MWGQISTRMRSRNVTDGSEYNDGKPIDNNPRISHTHCDYCRRDVLGVWDDYNKDKWYPYLGNQARKPRTYGFSPIIRSMREFYGVTGQVWGNDPSAPNELLNLHARIHTYPNNWQLRAHPRSLKILCNECFQKTYKRVKLLVPDRGIRVEVSVMPEFGETVQSVCEEIGIPFSEENLL